MFLRISATTSSCRRKTHDSRRQPGVIKVEVNRIIGLLARSLCGSCRSRRWRSAGHNKVKISTARTHKTRRQIRNLKIRVALMQERKAGIRSKYPQAFRQDISFKWQPVRRLIFTPAPRKVHKNTRLRIKARTARMLGFVRRGERCTIYFNRPKGATSLFLAANPSTVNVARCGNMQVRTIRKPRSAHRKILQMQPCDQLTLLRTMVPCFVRQLFDLEREEQNLSQVSEENRLFISASLHLQKSALT